MPELLPGVSPPEYPGMVRLINWWSARTWTDYGIAAVVPLIYAGIRRGGLGPYVVLNAAARATVYEAILAASAAVLGFVLVPAAIVLALTPGPRLTFLLENHSDDLRRATVHAAFVVLFTLGVCVLALGVDAQTGNTPTRYLVAWAFVLVLFGAVRLVDLFSVLLRNVGKDKEEESNQKPVLPDLTIPNPPEGLVVRAVSTSSRPVS
jgi:hypothetical protein